MLKFKRNGSKHFQDIFLKELNLSKTKIRNFIALFILKIKMLKLTNILN